MGLALAGLAMLAIIAAWLACRRGAGRRWRRRAGRTSADSITELAAGEAAAAAEAHPYGVFWAAFLAGLVLGASPDVRDIVKTALRASDR